MGGIVNLFTISYSQIFKITIILKMGKTLPPVRLSAHINPIANQIAEMKMENEVAKKEEYF